MKKVTIYSTIFIIVLLLAFGYIMKDKLGFEIVSDFVKPLWARLECLPDDSWSGSTVTSYVQSANEAQIKCGINEFTDECRVEVTVAKIGAVDDGIKYFLCNIDGTNCGAEQKEVLKTGWYGSGEASIDLDSLAKGKMYKITCYETDIFINKKDCTITKTYRPWGLYDYFGGGKRVVNNKNCNVPVSAKENILKADDTEVLYMTGGEGMKWINYVHDWAYGPATNVFSHPQHGQVYCTGGQLYSIVKVTTASGKIKQLAPDYVATASDGTIYNGLGQNLGTVECCPSSYNCGDDFKWTTPSGHTCQGDIDCAGGGAIICKTATTTTQWKCIDNKCAQQPEKSVECCSNAACTNGKICQLGAGPNQYKCIQGGGGSFCGDKKCDADETKLSCPQDCGSPDDDSSDWTIWIIAGAIILAAIIIAMMMGGKKQSGGAF
jgi:hypothetical protein